LKEQTGFFRKVRALPDYKLEIETRTDVHIVFNFQPWLSAVRFDILKDNEVFKTVRADGDFILFEKDQFDKVQIHAREFMSLILRDRSGNISDESP
jgi:hypothetical protein